MRIKFSSPNVMTFCQGCSANKKLWELIQKIAISKQFPTHFEEKREKGSGTPFPPHYTPAFYSVHICNIWTQYGMALVQTANKDCCFVFSRVFFVTFVPATRYFRCGPVFILLVINFFDNQQVTFLRLDEFENNFWIVVKAASAPETSQYAWEIVRMRFSQNVYGIAAESSPLCSQLGKTGCVEPVGKLNQPQF